MKAIFRTNIQSSENFQWMMNWFEEFCRIGSVSSMEKRTKSLRTIFNWLECLNDGGTSQEDHGRIKVIELMNEMIEKEHNNINHSIEFICSFHFLFHNKIEQKQTKWWKMKTIQHWKDWFWTRYSILIQMFNLQSIPFTIWQHLRIVSFSLVAKRSFHNQILELRNW